MSLAQWHLWVGFGVLVVGLIPAVIVLLVQIRRNRNVAEDKPEQSKRAA